MTLFAWGANSYGQLGLGYASEQQNIPIVVDIKVEFFKIVGGGGHTLAITAENNRLFGCGWNHAGQLGDHGGSGDLHTFTFLGLARVVDIAAGWDFTLVLTEEGKVFGCGSNKFGQLGADKEVSQSTKFLNIPGLSEIVEISAGLRHAAALSKNGTVYTWGAGSKGQLGRDWTSTKWEHSMPTNIQTDLNIIDSISCGQFFTLMKTSSGEIYGFGDNKFNQISHNNEKQIKIPTLLIQRNISSISAGWTHSIAMDQLKQVHTWGRNNYGQCATNSFSHSQLSSHTVKIAESLENNEDINIVKCIAGSEHCLMLDSHGCVTAWGWNEHGNLGNNSLENSHTPIKLKFSLGDTGDGEYCKDNGAKICDIFVGSAHCFAYSKNK